MIEDKVTALLPFFFGADFSSVCMKLYDKISVIFFLLIFILFPRV